MKKILLGLLIIGALSACSTTDVEGDIKTLNETVATQAQEYKKLNETVTTQAQEYESLKAETEELKMQVQELSDSINESKN